MAGIVGGDGGGVGGGEEGGPAAAVGNVCLICGRGVGEGREVCGRRVCRLLAAFVSFIRLLDRLLRVYVEVRGIYDEVRRGRRGPDGGGAGGAGGGALDGDGMGLVARLFGDGADDGGGGGLGGAGGPDGGDGAALRLFINMLNKGV